MIQSRAQHRGWTTYVLCRPQHDNHVRLTSPVSGTPDHHGNGRRQPRSQDDDRRSSEETIPEARRRLHAAKLSGGSNRATELGRSLGRLTMLVTPRVERLLGQAQKRQPEDVVRYTVIRIGRKRRVYREPIDERDDHIRE